MKKITVLLADDHTIVRQGLRSLLEVEKEIEIIAEASKGTEAVRLAVSLKPNVVVMDISMPELNGLQATEQIRKQDPSINVLILSMYIEEEYLHQVIQAGASGYLVKQTASTDLVNAIKEIHQGNAFFSPVISKILLNWYKNFLSNGTGLHASGLSSREFEILRLVAQGRTSNDIANALFVSAKTVEKCRKQIMEKLNLHDVPSLTKYVISKGYLDDIYH